MNPTNIEWVVNPDGSVPGWTSNPMTGCENHVKGLCKDGGFPCYAYRLAHGRVEPLYLANDNIANPIVIGSTIDEAEEEAMEKLTDPFYYRFWPKRLEELHNRNRGIHRGLAPKERGIFMCDMGDLFGDCVPQPWQNEVLHAIDLNQGWDRFYLLTKQPQNLPRWSPFPDNCWVGVTVTSENMMKAAQQGLDNVACKYKYISFEPMLGRLSEWSLKQIRDHLCQWVIIGGCTGTQNDLSGLRKKYPHLHLIPYGKKWVLAPPIEHVEELVRAADKAGIPVFLKDNLWPLCNGSIGTVPKWAFNNEASFRQEFPEKGDNT